MTGKRRKEKAKINRNRKRQKNEEEKKTQTERKSMLLMIPDDGRGPAWPDPHKSDWPRSSSGRDRQASLETDRQPNRYRDARNVRSDSAYAAIHVMEVDEQNRSAVV